MPDDRNICGLCAHQRDDADLYAFNAYVWNLSTREKTLRTIVVCNRCSEDARTFEKRSDTPPLKGDKP
jgi:hypothetical protein